MDSELCARNNDKKARYTAGVNNGEIQFPRRATGDLLKYT